MKLYDVREIERDNETSTPSVLNLISTRSLSSARLSSARTCTFLEVPSR
jgi:hypothetical protein